MCVYSVHSLLATFLNTVSLSYFGVNFDLGVITFHVNVYLKPFAAFNALSISDISIDSQHSLFLPSQNDYIIHDVWYVDI